MDDILKKVIKVSLIALVITHGMAFFMGMYINSIVNSEGRVAIYQEKLANVTEQNIDYKVQVMGNDTEIENLKQEISRLNLYKSQMTENYNKMLEERNSLKLKLITLQNDYDYLKIRYTALENKCGVTDSSSQSETETPVTTTTTAGEYTPYMTYPPYGSRGTLPYPTTYTTVTPNVTKFSSGLSIEEVVNKIRFQISYRP